MIAQTFRSTVESLEARLRKSRVQLWRLVMLLLGFIVLIHANQAHAKHHKKKKFIDEAVKALELALVVAPKDQEICFSPDEHCDTKLIKFVSGANESIDLAVYDINLDQLVHQLLLQSRNVRVRIVVDRRQAKGDHSLVPLLIKAGAQIKYGHQRGIMHDKFTIVDGAMIETGSFNYTNHASVANQENQVYLANPLIVARFKTRFERMWETAREFSTETKSIKGVDTDLDSEAEAETE